MNKRVIVVLATVVIVVLMFVNRQKTVEAQAKPGMGFAAVPGAVGGQDIFGAYDVAKEWPKDISTVPGNEKWTYGAGQGVYAENPNRVFMLFRGELPKIPRPPTKLLPEFGPSIQFPIGRLPWRDATVSALPGAGGTGQDPDDGPKLWKGTVGIDAKWENCIVVADANGNIVERWTQWDKILKRPHFVAISPYDPGKYVWIVDDHMHAIYRFSHDGKQLLQTIGTPTVKSADGTHFNRPTFLNWLPDGTLFVADGYNGTRVAKFDKNGKFLMDWGMKGTPPHDKRPGYFNNACIQRTGTGALAWPLVEPGGGTNFGNSGVGIVVGPGQNNSDIAIIKRTAINWLREGANVEFRTEFFNAFNQVHFAAPNATVGSGSFGQITSANPGVRVVILTALRHREREAYVPRLEGFNTPFRGVEDRAPTLVVDRAAKAFGLQHRIEGARAVRDDYDDLFGAPWETTRVRGDREVPRIGLRCHR